jgi:hypothetical protein
MNWAILLTSCVRSNKPNDPKMEYYLRAIKDWLEKTNLPIFIVESSGYTFPEFENTRLKVCSFDLTNQASSSQYEAKSILFAMDYFKNDLEPYTHILKVTARYYVDVENILPSLPDVDMILQSQHNHVIKWNNSEMFGFRTGFENCFLRPIIDCGFMEHTIYQFAFSHSFHRLQPIANIYKVRRGGDNLIVDPL